MMMMVGKKLRLVVGTMLMMAAALSVAAAPPQQPPVQLLQGRQRLHGLSLRGFMGEDGVLDNTAAAAATATPTTEAPGRRRPQRPAASNNRLLLEVRFFCRAIVPLCRPCWPTENRRRRATEAAARRQTACGRRHRHDHDGPAVRRACARSRSRLIRFLVVTRRSALGRSPR